MEIVFFFKHVVKSILGPVIFFFNWITVLMVILSFWGFESVY
jgi:hypothetical protein